MATEQRHQPDRRRRPRGGRRASDVAGYTPLVFVVDGNDRRREISEAILAKLKFAVAPFPTVDAAVSVMKGLRPEVVAAGRVEYMRLRDRLTTGVDGLVIPLALIADDASPDAIVEAVRAALRTATVVPLRP
jgi:hypothetical protein